MSIPADRFPWLGHRTLREVARTDELLAKACGRREKFTHAETCELGSLLKRAYRHNPPSEPGEVA